MTPFRGYFGCVGCVFFWLFGFGQGCQKSRLLGLRRRSVFMFRAGFEKTWFGLNFFNLRKTLFGRLWRLPRGRRPGRGPGRPAGEISKNWEGRRDPEILEFYLKCNTNTMDLSIFPSPGPLPNFGSLGPPGRPGWPRRLAGTIARDPLQNDPEN